MMGGMAGKTFHEAAAEFEADLRQTGRTIADELAATRVVRAIFRGCEWLDRKLPWLAKVDRLPRWTRFGTSEWFQAIGVLYLVFLAVFIVAVILTGR